MTKLIKNEKENLLFKFQETEDKKLQVSDLEENQIKRLFILRELKIVEDLFMEM